MKQWIMDRLREKATWAGIAGLLGMLGVAIEPSQAEVIAQAGIGVVSALAIIWPDKR